LFAWTELSSVPAQEVAAMLRPKGVIEEIVEDFRTRIGLWAGGQ
jgi:hypothetical protein